MSAGNALPYKLVHACSEELNTNISSGGDVSKSFVADRGTVSPFRYDSGCALGHGEKTEVLERVRLRVVGQLCSDRSTERESRQLSRRKGGINA